MNGVISIYNKKKIFEQELNYLKTPQIRSFAEAAVEKLPDYFFHVAASSSGKHHPAYALGKGGLVRHTKAAVRIAAVLLDREYYQAHFDDRTRDCILVALMLHDGWKHGDDGSPHTVATHPLVAANWVLSDEFKDALDKSTRSFISRLIASHMGQWNTAFRSTKEILPKPNDELEMFVHMCDYLASRKWIVVEFDPPYYDAESECFLVNDGPSLEEMKKTIVDLCKEKIKAGTNRDLILDTIARLNDGRKNPLSISNIETATKVLKEVQNI